MKDECSRNRYTLEFKQEAGCQVKAGRAAWVAAKTPGMPKASLINCVRADASGQLGMTAEGKPAPVLTPEQVEAARLRAEVARAASAQHRCGAATSLPAHRRGLALSGRRDDPHCRKW